MCIHPDHHENGNDLSKDDTSVEEDSQGDGSTRDCQS